MLTSSKLNSSSTDSTWTSTDGLSTLMSCKQCTIDKAFCQISVNIFVQCRTPQWRSLSSVKPGLHYRCMQPTACIRSYAACMQPAYDVHPGVDALHAACIKLVKFSVNEHANEISKWNFLSVQEVAKQFVVSASRRMQAAYARMPPACRMHTIVCNLHRNVCRLHAGYMHL